MQLESYKFQFKSKLIQIHVQRNLSEADPIFLDKCPLLERIKNVCAKSPVRFTQVSSCRLYLPTLDKFHCIEEFCALSLKLHGKQKYLAKLYPYIFEVYWCIHFVMDINLSSQYLKSRRRNSLSINWLLRLFMIFFH